MSKKGVVQNLQFTPPIPSLDDDVFGLPLIVTTEGTAVWLYNYSGCWIGNLTLNSAIFEMQYNGSISNDEDDDGDDNFIETWGFADGFGVESLSFTGDFSTAIFTVSAPLVQHSQIVLV